jgi:predicted nucleic acid-binding protein
MARGVMPTAPLVIDASIAVAITRREPAGAAASDALRGWIRDRRRLIVPGHFWLEVANAFGTRRLPGADVLEAIHELDGFGLETIDTERSQLLVSIDLMERYGLTAYDATYLALALVWDGLLVTFDRALQAAAAERAIQLGPSRMSETHAVYEGPRTWPDYKGASAFLAKLRAEAAARPG